MRRSVGLFLSACLCMFVLPARGAASHAAAANRPQREIAPVEDGNPYTYEVGGNYWAGGQYVGVNAYSVESDTYYAPTADGGWEERVDFYYSDGEVRKTDGTHLTYAVYELDRAAARGLMHVTLGGVTLTFDLAAEQAHLPPQEQQAAIDAWVASGDGTLAQEAHGALLNQDGRQDVWVNHVITAMLLDPSPDGASESALRKVKKRPVAYVNAFMSKLKPAVGGGFTQPCLAASDTPAAKSALANWPAKRALANFAAPAGSGRLQCFGCCGSRCDCIQDRQGRPIYSRACAAHDYCIMTSRHWALSLLRQDCAFLAVAAAIVVIDRRVPRAAPPRPQ